MLTFSFKCAIIYNVVKCKNLYEYIEGGTNYGTLANVFNLLGWAGNW
jgi:hypothetical protein